MTSQKDQIQLLIAEIDTVLQKTSPRLPWVMSGEATQQRQVLERVRNYLVAFQTHQSVEGAVGQLDPRPDLLAHDIYYQAQSSPPAVARVGSEQPDELTPQQMLQAVMQEMSYLRTSLMQPLRQDLDVLRQQRDALTQEIQQLEAQRRHHELSQSPLNQQQLVGDFLQVLMGRLQESLAQQVAQTLENLQHQAMPATGNPMLTGMAEPATALAPQLEQLQALQARSDQLLVGLDSSLRVVFESLQQSIQAYQESLTQGVDRLHTLGQQGEVMVNALLNHLAQRLGQEASSYLQSSAQQFAGLETGSTTIDSLRAFPETVAKTTAPLAGGTLPEFPYAGIELPSANAEPSASTPVDAAIESWLQSVSATNQIDTLDLGESSLAALDLSQLELGQVDANNLDAILSLDLNLTDANALAEPELFSPDTLADLAESPEGSFEPLTEPEIGGGVTEEDTEDIDAALKLLEQLSQELQDQPQTLAIADAEATLDRIIAPPPVSTAATDQQPSIPDDARDELDEFYESFFGTATIVPSQPELESPSLEPPSPVEPAAIAEPDWDIETIGTLTLDSELEFPEFGAADDTLSLPELEADSALLSGNLSEVSSPPELEISLEDELFGIPMAEPSAIEITVPHREPDTNQPESDFAHPIGPSESPSENWLPEPNFLDSFFDEQDAIARSESVAALEVDLEPVDLATLAEEGESGIPEQIGSLTELTDLFPEASQPISPESTPNAPSHDRFPVAMDLPTDTSLDLELTISVAQGQSVPASQSGTNTIPGSDDLYVLAAPEEDLLPTNPLDDELDFNLDLDEAILNRLSADLSSLEALADQSPQLLGSESHQEAFSLTLDDWTTEAPAAQAPEATFSETNWPEVESSAAVPEAAEAEAEAEAEPTLSYAELSLEEFATALPEVPLPVSEPSLEAFDPALSEPELSLEEFATEISEVSSPETEASLEEFTIALEASPSEGDWQEASLEDFASAIPAAPIADTEPSLEEFATALPELPLSAGNLSLEGLAPAQPELATSESEAALSSVELDERLDDLFAEPSVPSTIESPPPFILEGMDDLFGEATPASQSPPLVTPVVPNEPLPFTLEGMDSLFEDLPSAASQKPTSPTTPPIEPDATSTPNSPFTQENIETLFSRNKLSGEGSRLAAKPAQSSPSFTLEGMDSLFDDAPPVEPTEASTVPDTAKPTEDGPPPSYVPTLERIDHLFEQAAPMSLGTETTPQAAPLVDSIENLFGNAATAAAVPPAPIVPEPSPESLSPDRREEMDDLFGEAPPLSMESLSPTAEELAAFTLEGMDDLFVEPPTKSSSATIPQSAPAHSSAAMDALTLDEAFESLLGSPPLDPSSSNAPIANPSTTPEKKKKTR